MGFTGIECEGVKWIILPKDRVQRWVVRVPKKAGSFLIG
jgi:hypothetical protein